MIRAERTSPPDAEVELLVIDRTRVAIHVRDGERAVIGEISVPKLRQVLAEMSLLRAAEREPMHERGAALRTEGAGSPADASEMLAASDWRNRALAVGLGTLDARSRNFLTTPTPEGFPVSASNPANGAERFRELNRPVVSG